MSNIPDCYISPIDSGEWACIYPQPSKPLATSEAL